MPGSALEDATRPDAKDKGISISRTFTRAGTFVQLDRWLRVLLAKACTRAVIPDTILPYGACLPSAALCWQTPRDVEACPALTPESVFRWSKRTPVP